MDDHEAIEVAGEVEPHVDMLLRENATLKNWVIGMLEGCEGCRGEAAQWAGAMASSHEAEAANGEVKN